VRAVAVKRRDIKKQMQRATVRTIYRRHVTRRAAGMVRKAGDRVSGNFAHSAPALQTLQN
jgi:hypothetical protein